MLTQDATLNIDHDVKAKATTTSSSPRKDKDGFLATLDPSFIHRILLTDASEFSSLITSTDAANSNGYTLSFGEFKHSLEQKATAGNLDNPSMVAKKAVRDHILSQINLGGNNQQQPAEDPASPLHDLLLAAHKQIRSLIPNRRDLHSILDDEQVKNVKALGDLAPLLAKAAESLAQLESESRAVTTRALLVEYLQKDSQINKEEQTTVSFWLAGIMYLLYKTELCQKDKEDFYLVHVWAPRIHREGPAFEKELYQKQFGRFADSKSSSATRQWIHSLEQSHNPAKPQGQDAGEDHGHNSSTTENNPLAAHLQKSQEDRTAMIRAAWIDDIVFRDSSATTTSAGSQKAFHLPEIFSQDREGLQTLRDVSRLAVAGCALVLHACNAVGVNSHQVLTNSTDPRRSELLNALRNRSVPQEKYENDVADAVVALAQSWSPSLLEKDSGDNDVLQSLKSRTVAVLRGEDPVLELLNKRVKTAVRDVLVQRMHHKKEGVAPLDMRTGLAERHTQSSSKKESHPDEGKNLVETLFCQRGLGFFAPELALVAKRAGKIVDLAIDLYWDDLLDKIILDSCQQESS